MLPEKANLVHAEIERGTGAAIEFCPDTKAAQTGLLIWFADLGRARSPIVALRPVGLKRYQAQLSFGNLAAATIAQMQAASFEEWSLARALLAEVEKSAAVTLQPPQGVQSWSSIDASFMLTVEKRGVQNRFGDEAIVDACREIVTPLLGAMAELFGYDPIDADDANSVAPMEGSIRVAVVKRRERNPRSRWLCLEHNGAKCAVCGLVPDDRYGAAGSILEVHHLQPLAQLGEPRAYDPRTDLKPLCPNCHRAVHTRKPVPLTLEELKAMLRD